jgi:alkanesulfonate monooxygenase SsuD/methylene tetrahydromethanopterin reductase-like flavin-dependent oxidoreductase (luciferase family)
MVERARAAREAELDALFVGDHHAVPAPFVYYQNVPVLGRLLAEWGDAPFGALYLLPLWHPVVVAEQVGTLAALGTGRFVLQCAIGAGEGQFAAMGADIHRRPHAFETALGVIRRLLAGEEVTSDEGPWSIGATRVSPVPAEPVEVWIGAAAEPAIDRAARLGDAWLAGPELTPASAREQLGQYLGACERHGRTPTCVPIRRDVYVGETEADVARYGAPVVAGGYRGFDPAAPVLGTVEQVADAFRVYGDLGFTDVIVRQLVEDHAAAVASLRRLGEVRRLLAAR